MEEKENNLVIEVRKPETTVDEIKQEESFDNTEEVQKVETTEEHSTELDDIQAQVLKFQEEVSKFQNEINKDKIKGIDAKEIPEEDQQVPEVPQEDTKEIYEKPKETKQYVSGNVTRNEITSTAQGITDAIVQRLETENSVKPERKGIVFHFNRAKELREINCKTICEFKKTGLDFDINKVKIYNVEDDGKLISFLFHDGDFFAINRINFPDGYEYTEKTKPQLSENLNHKIRKIPNVAKTRHILKIEDIETRIFDMTQYILLLSKKGTEIRILKVNNGKDLSDAEYKEEVFDKKEYIDIINDYECIEEELDREEYEMKSRFSKVKEFLANIVINPFRILKEKLAKTRDLKLLSEGKNSVFDNEDE